MIHVTVTNRTTSEKKAYKFTQNAILIGRQNNCDIVLDSQAVSRRHAKMTINKNLVEIEDLGSGNGTIINQNKIKSKSKVPIKPDDKIRIEEFDIDVDLLTTAEAQAQIQGEVTDPDIIEIKMIKKLLGALEQDKHPSLLVVSEEFLNEKAVFDGATEELSIGRDPECDLCLDTGTVSRKHAIIQIKWGGFVITDLQSKNGTFVNGQKITAEKSIKDGDEIVFGTIKTIFKSPQELDLSSIANSIQEEKEKLAQEAAAKALEAKTPAPTPEPEPEGASQAAKDSATAAGEPQNQPESKKEKKKESIPVKKTPFSTEAAPEAEAPAPKQEKPLLKSLSSLEIALFAFGAIVILITLVVLVILFS